MAEEQGVAGRIWDYLKERVQAIPSEVAQTVTDKVIPQGATELAQALYNGQSNCFTAYGHAQAPLTVEGPVTSYQQAIREASQNAEPDYDRSRGIDR